MKILIVGAGGIGGYYGARLLQVGGDVTFLVREKRATLLATQGLRVRSELGDFNEPVNVILREQLYSGFDLILLSCKSYDLDTAMDDIQPAVGRDTRILPFLNGLSVYDELDARFGRDRVLGGVAYIATMLDKEGVIRHFGANDRVIVGARSEATEQAAANFHALISQTPGSRSLSPDVTQELWNKWVTLASGAMMNCLMRGTIADILSTEGGADLMKQAMAECRSVADAQNHSLSQEEVQLLEARLLDKGSDWAASMMRDIAHGAPRLEAKAIVGDMIIRAMRHGLDVPLTQAAYCNLQVYERQQTADAVAAVFVR